MSSKENFRVTSFLGRREHGRKWAQVPSQPPAKAWFPARHPSGRCLAGLCSRGRRACTLMGKRGLRRGQRRIATYPWRAGHRGVLRALRGPAGIPGLESPPRPRDKLSGPPLASVPPSQPALPAAPQPPRRPALAPRAWRRDGGAPRPPQPAPAPPPHSSSSPGPGQSHPGRGREWGWGGRAHAVYPTRRLPSHCSPQ